MAVLLQEWLANWAAIMGVGSVESSFVPWLSAVYCVIGALLAFAGVKLFRPTFSMVAFFGVTALLMLALRQLLPWFAVVSIVAVLGVFAAFLGLFMKRVAISCLSTLGAAAIGLLVTGMPLVGVVCGAVALAASLFKPKEAYIGIAALFGSSLCVSSAGSFAALELGFGLQNEFLAAVAAVAFAAAGAAVQAFLSRNGLDPVFTQVIDLPPVGARRSEDASSHGVEEAADKAASIELAAGGSGVLAGALLSKAAGKDGRPIADAKQEAKAAEGKGAAGREGEEPPCFGEDPAEVPSRAGQPALSRAERYILEAGLRGEPVLGAAKVAIKREARQRSPLPKEPSSHRDGNVGQAGGTPFQAEPLRIERPEPFKPSYRKEIKYRIIEQDFLRLRNVMDAYLAYDSYSGAKGYPVRSLYFDSLDDRDLYSKLDGTLEHKKIRMRTYDPLGDAFNLEYKCRWNQDGFKQKLKLNRKQAKRLAANDYRVLLEFDGPLARELFDRMVRGRYTPKVIVEYQRTAWVYPTSNIRVTWDQGIKASYFPESFFEERPLYIPILPDCQGVLEIKYDYVFPSILKDALHSLDQLPVANSKYALGRTYL